MLDALTLSDCVCHIGLKTYTSRGHKRHWLWFIMHLPPALPSESKLLSFISVCQCLVNVIRNTVSFLLSCGAVTLCFFTSRGQLYNGLIIGTVW